MASLKCAIKAVMPPILFNTLTGRRAEKTCPTWDAACASAGSYEADTVNWFRVQRHELRKPDGSLLQGSVLGLVAAALHKASISVVDFGGATGDLGLEFLYSYPNSNYTVVENPTMVALMQGKSAVQFASAIPTECDIFYSSGTLQYLATPLDVLRSGLESARHAAVLVRNSFSDVESFHVQHSALFDNGSGPIPSGYSNRHISYPHRTIRESEVMRLAQELGFRCHSRLEETSGSRGSSYGKQLVFLRT